MRAIRPRRAARGGGASAAGLALVLACACAPRAGPEPAMAHLDCAQPFEALRTKVTGQPHLVPAPKSPSEPYRYYSSEDGATSYLITEPGAPGHPAVMMQRAQGGQVRTEGCPYGDKAGFEALRAYLDGLKNWRRK